VNDDPEKFVDQGLALLVDAFVSEWRVAAEVRDFQAAASDDCGNGEEMTRPEVP